MIEFIVVISIIGIVLALGLGQFRPTDRVQVQQAGRSFVSTVQRARFEAIGRNRFAGVRMLASGYQVWVDADDSRTYSIGEETQTVAMGELDTRYVQMSNASANGVVFDPRGLRFNGGAFNVDFRSTIDNNYRYQAQVNALGRAILVKP